MKLRIFSSINKWFINISIQIKVVFIMILQSAIVMSLVSLAVFAYFAYSKHKEAGENLASLVNIVAINVSPSLVFNDKIAAQETLNGLKGNRQIIAACIFDNSNAVFAQYPSNDSGNNRDLAEIFKKTTANEKSLTWDKNIVAVTDIVVDGKTIGKLLIQLNLSLLYLQLGNFLIIVGAIFILVLLLTYFLSNSLQLLINTPILKLAQTMLYVSKSADFSIRVEKNSLDEVGTLIECFNNMLVNIHERDDRIAGYNESLEDAICKRTAELSATNSELMITISDLNVAKKAVEVANNAKSQFLANMSHEIRTPINGIMGMTQILMKSELTRRQQQFAATIKSSSDSLLKIVNDILDFSKIEAGCFTIESTPFNLLDAINDIIESFTGQALSKEIKLLSAIDPQVPYSVEGDPSRLRQILVNLLNNALKFTERGKITIEVTNALVTADHAVIKFEVTDTGIGITPETLPLIFDRFSQADSSTTRRFGGTGLGLTIAKQLTELMGGQIGVDSSFGIGSTFWFTVRLALFRGQLPVSIHKRNEEYLGGFASKTAKILVVDDTMLNLEICCELLMYLGYPRPTVVNNGSEALEILSIVQFDLILMDCQMPVMDGYEATSKYRELELKQGDKHLPIIALTGNAMENDRQLCLDVGMDDYLLKPIILERLKEVLVFWLKNSPQTKCRENVDEAKAATSDPAHDGAMLVLDRAKLDALRAIQRPGTPNILAKIISMFETNSPLLVITMRQSFAQNNTEEMLRSVHTLKTSSAMLGAQFLADRCNSFETILRQGGELRNANAIIDEIEMLSQSAMVLLSDEI